MQDKRADQSGCRNVPGRVSQALKRQDEQQLRLLIPVWVVLGVLKALVLYLYSFSVRGDSR